MKKYEDRVESVRREVGIICDFCKQRIKEEGYCVDRVDIEYRSGVGYPDGGDIKHVMFDICGECFMGKFVPWAQSEGALPTIEDVSW